MAATQATNMVFSKLRCDSSQAFIQGGGPKDGHFSEIGDFQRPVLGGNLHTSVLYVKKNSIHSAHLFCRPFTF